MWAIITQPLPDGAYGECAGNTVCRTVEAAVRAGVSLACASLNNANLLGANLTGADMRGANLNN